MLVDLLPPSAVGSDTRTALTFGTPRCSFNWAREVADTTDSESSEGPVGSVSFPALAHGKEGHETLAPLQECFRIEA